MLIPSGDYKGRSVVASLSRRVNANSQPTATSLAHTNKLIKKGEC